MRYAAGLILVLGLLMCGCLSRDEILRVTFPDGRVDAIVFETDCGATCPFGYDIWLTPKGSRHSEEVASLDGALRNAQAWGVNLKWLDADTLSVDYLRADRSTLLKQAVDFAGHSLKVSPHGGVEDPPAPANGMLYKLIYGGGGGIVLPIGDRKVRSRRALGCLLLSTAFSDLTESPVFMRVPRAANRPKVVARVVAIYGLVAGAHERALRVENDRADGVAAFGETFATAGIAG